MPDIRFFLKVSRPRFWIYVLGPYLIGLVAGVNDKNELFSLFYLIFGIYFLYPANLLIYGVNDIFDYETDKLNEKKVEYETLVTPERRSALWLAIFLANFAFIDIIFFGSTAVAVSGLSFLFFSIFYSAPPIRAKTKPFLDSAFNVLYILPGVFGYSLVTVEFPPASVVIAGALWTAAMHAYSAIPDIEADRDAKLSTIATVLGSTGTHVFCLAAYIGSAVLSYQYLGIVSVVLGSVFFLTMVASMITHDRDGVFRIYRLFPIINAAAGFILFWAIAIPKFLN